MPGHLSAPDPTLGAARRPRPRRRPCEPEHRSIFQRRIALMSIVVLLVAVGIFFRWQLGLSPVAGINSDEAVVGIVAESNLAGRPTAFYPGQEYGGTLGSFPVSLADALLGRSLLALRISAFLESLLLMVVIYKLAAASGVNRLTTLGLVSLWPLMFVAFSVHEMLFYNAVLLLSCGVWWISLVERDYSAWRFVQPLVMGFLTGLAFWTTPQSMLLLIPVLGVFGFRWLRTLARFRSFLSFGILFSLAALVGLIPWLYRNITTGFASLGGPWPRTEPYGRRVLISVRGLIFQPFGDLQQQAGEVLPKPGFTLILGIFFLALILLGIRRDADRVSLAILITLPFLAAINPLSGIPGAQVRYVFVAWPAVVLLTAAVLARPGLLSAALTAVLIASIVVSWNRQVRYWYPDDHTALAPLANALRSVREGGVLASYWDAYRLNYLCDDCPRLIPFVVVRSAPGDVSPPSSLSYILAGPHAPASRMYAELRRRGIDFDSRVLPAKGYVLIHTLYPVPATLFSRGEFGG